MENAVNIICDNPRNIRLNSILKVLAEQGNIKHIVKIAISKSKCLNRILEEHEYSNNNEENSNNQYYNHSVIDSHDNYSNYQFDSIIDNNIVYNPNTNTNPNNIYIKLSKEELNLINKELKDYLILVERILKEVDRRLNNGSSTNNKTNKTTKLSTKEMNRILNENTSFPSCIKPLFTNKNYNTKNTNTSNNEAYEFYLLNIKDILIKEILKADMKYLHTLVFNYLINTNTFEALLKINSEAVEKYLLKELAYSSSNNLKYLVYVYKYYNHNQYYTTALKYLMNIVNWKNIESDLANTSLDNNNINDENNINSNKNLLILFDRSTYTNQAYIILEKIKEEENNNNNNNTINNTTNISNTSDYISKHKDLSLLTEILDIQISLFDYLKELLSKQTQIDNKSRIEHDLKILNYQNLNLKSLYENFSKPYKNYEVSIRLFMALFKLEKTTVGGNINNTMNYLITEIAEVHFKAIFSYYTSKDFQENCICYFNSLFSIRISGILGNSGNIGGISGSSNNSVYEVLKYCNANSYSSNNLNNMSNNLNKNLNNNRNLNISNSNSSFLFINSLFNILEFIILIEDNNKKIFGVDYNIDYAGMNLSSKASKASNLVNSNMNISKLDFSNRSRYWFILYLISSKNFPISYLYTLYSTTIHNNINIKEDFYYYSLLIFILHRLSMSLENTLDSNTIGNYTNISNNLKFY